MKVGAIVTNDLRAAEVFKSAGIDFCCGGNRTLEEVCNEQKIVIDEVVNELRQLEHHAPDARYNFKEWGVVPLVHHIVETHHRRELKQLALLNEYISKIAVVHGMNHPELSDIEELFAELYPALLQHFEDEEKRLFPAAEEVLTTNSAPAKALIIAEIEKMTGEHEFAGATMDKIHALSNGYQVPADGCNTYRVAYQQLQQFEDDLHIHVHLENNILYPKLLELARKE